MKTTDMTFTLGLDFDMLNKQKKLLLEQLEGLPQSMLWGIVHMIDDIQDEAEKQGLWEYPDSSGEDLGKVRRQKSKENPKASEEDFEEIK